MQTPQPFQSRVLCDPGASARPRSAGVNISFDDKAITLFGDRPEHAANVAFLEKLEFVATRQYLPDSIAVVL
jgi:hypothetical protein